MFDHVIGLTDITGRLATALAQDRLAHAYLFRGQEGGGEGGVGSALGRGGGARALRVGLPAGCRGSDVCAGRTFVQVWTGQGYLLVRAKALRDPPTLLNVLAR